MINDEIDGGLKERRLRSDGSVAPLHGRTAALHFAPAASATGQCQLGIDGHYVSPIAAFRTCRIARQFGSTLKLREHFVEGLASPAWKRCLPLPEGNARIR